MAQDKEPPGSLGQYKVLTNSPAPALGGSSASAFWAQQKAIAGQAAGQTAQVALTGDRTSFFRSDSADRYKGLSSPFLMRLVEWGVIDWPDNSQKLALIFQRPTGPSVHDAVIAAGRRMTDAEIVAVVLPSVVKALRELAANGLVHSAIRPSNIYMASDGTVMLGECLSGAAGFDQPVSLLTIDRSLASPLGRGTGTIADDIYALGATLVSLATGGNALATLDAQQAVAQKISRGSLWALKGQNHIGSNLYVLLRGIMNDDPAQRWGLDEIELWINGRHASSPSIVVNEAPRPLIIQGVEYWDARSIADAFSRNVPEAMRLIGNDELIKWVRRTLRNLTLAERIADAVNMPLMTGKLGSHDSRLVARVVMALHPAGPIRYHGYAMMPDAFGTLLSKTLMAGESPQILAEMLIAQLPAYWYNIQQDFHEDHVAPLKLFEFARAMVEQVALGAGIERCHYELTPGAAYTAEGFEKFFIRDARQFLQALEIVAGSANKPVQPITRQAAAFLAARDAQLGNRSLGRLARATSEGEKAIGALHALATVQNHYSVDKLPQLCTWLETMLQPAIERLHSRKAREVMRQDLHRAAATGHLPTLLAAIENPIAFQQDHDGLVEARRQFTYFEIEKSILQQELLPGSHIHRSVGREAATVVAGILAVLATATMVAMQIGQVV